jgi:hypothetical protein
MALRRVSQCPGPPLVILFTLTKIGEKSLYHSAPYIAASSRGSAPPEAQPKVPPERFRLYSLIGKLVIRHQNSHFTGSSVVGLP